jgi:hypothetical protein
MVNIWKQSLRRQRLNLFSGSSTSTSRRRQKAIYREGLAAIECLEDRLLLAAATKLAFALQPSVGTAGQALGSIKVDVEDASSNVVTTDTSTVTISVATGPGGFAGGSTTSVAAVKGVATFSNLVLDTAGTYTLKVTDGTLTSTTSGNIVVSAAAASQLVYQQAPPSTGTAGQALGPAATVAVEDAFGNVVTGNSSNVKISVASGPGGFAAASTTKVAAVNGVATFNNLILDTSGTYTLQATDGALTPVTSGNVTISPALASQLVYQQAPTTGTAGQALSPAVQVAVEDTFGNVVTSDTSTVTIAVASGPGGFTGGSTTSIKAVSGVATFNNLVLDTSGNYTLTATDPLPATITSAKFVVTVAPASQLVYTRTPATGTAGQALSPSLTVTVEDAFGNVVTSDTSTVTIAVATGPSGFATGSTTSVAAVNGVAKFTNLILNTAGTYTLIATDGTLTSVISGNVVVSPAGANQLAYEQISGGTAGQALAPAVTVAVEDAFGNVVTSNTSNVKIAVASGPGGFDAASTTRVAAVNGVATFSNLILDTAGIYTLQATDGALTSITSGNITVNPAAASQLALEQAPTSGTAGQALAPAVTVTVEDPFGNVVTSDVSIVSIGVATGPGGFAAGSTTSVSAVSGVATFNNLVLDTSGTYTLTATDGTLASVTSGNVVIAVAPATQLVFQQTPASGTAGQALSPSLTVAVEDAFGNLVTSDTSTVTIAVASGPSGFAGGSTTSTAAVSGVATFNNLILDTSGTYTLTLTDGTLTSATTGNIVVSAAAASQLVYTQIPATGTAGQALAPTITVAVEDVFGNVVTSDTSNVKIIIASGPDGFDASSTTKVAAVNGVATFNNLIIDTAGIYTLSATDGPLTLATSGNITVSPAAASELVYLQAPTPVTVGQAITPAVQVAVEDAFDNVITSDVSTVTIAVATGPGVFTAGSTLSVAAVNGVATFNNLVLDTSGNYSLTATDGTLASVTSNKFAVATAPAIQLVYTRVTTTGTAGNPLRPSFRVAVEDVFGNVVTSDTSTVTIAVATGPDGFAAGSTTSLAVVNGVARFTNLVFDTAGTYTLIATDGTLTSVTSGDVVVDAAAASQLVYLQTPTTGSAGQPLAPAVEVAVEDAFGNVVTGNTSRVTMSVATGPGGFDAASTTIVSAVSGVATFSNLILDTPGDYTLTATHGTLTSATTGTIGISLGPASQLVLEQSPTSGTAGQALGALTVAVEDAGGNVITSDTSSVTISVATGPGGFASGSTISASVVNGVATFSNLILDTAGNYTLSVSDGGLTGATTGTITISPTTASQLVLEQAPSSGIAGQALGSMNVAVEDAFGNVVTSDTSTVTVVVATGPGGFTAGSTASVAAVSGVATFSNLTLNTAGSYTLSVSDGGLTGATTGTITVSPAGATQLVLQQSPTSGTDGQALGALTVAVEDAFGNIVTGDTSTVTVAVATGPSGFASGSTTSVVAASGVATFSNLILDTPGGYTLSVSDGGLTGATTDTITISLGPASQLVLEQSPASGTAGQALGALKVAVEDVTGNVITGDTSTVTVSVATGPGGFAGGSTTSVSVVNGVATFSNLLFDTAGNYTLSVNDGGLTGATTGTIAVSPATASQLVLQQSPSSGIAGQALSPSVNVAVEDAFGNIVTSDTSTVTIAVASGPGGFAAGSTTSVAAVSGVAAFSNLILNTPGSYTVSVSDAGLTGATTGTITVSPAAASQLVLQQSPTSGTAGQALSPTVKVAVEDVFGNVLTTNTSTVTIAVASGPGGFAAGSTTSVAAVNGVATFNNVILDTSGSYTLSVSDSGLAGATTGTITISPAAASQLVLQQSPTSGIAGQALSPSVTVAVEDGFGNVVTTNTSTVTIAVVSGPGGFAAGSTTSVAAASGIATFSNLILDTSGSYTLSVSDSGLAGATTGTITISPATASQLVLQQSPTSGTAGQALSPSVNVAIEDGFGNVVTSNTSTVTIAVATGPAGFASGSTTSMAAASGVATFSNLILDSSGSYTLSVSDGGLAGATTGTITISPALASQLVLQQSPTSGTTGQALSPSVKVAVEDAFGNVITSNTSTVTIAVASGPGGFTAGSTTSVAAVNGVATFSNLIVNTAGTYTLKATDGALASVTSGNITITGPSPPVLTAPGFGSLFENSSLVFSSSNGTAISFTDAAAGSNTDSVTLTVLHGTLTLSQTTGLTFTAGANNSSSFTVTGTLANLNAALNGLTYKPTTGYSGSDSLAIKVADSADSQSTTANVALTVTGVPSISAPASQSVAMNGDLQFAPTNSNAITLTDGSAGTSGVEQLTLIVTHGILKLASLAGITITGGANNSATMTIQGTLASLNAALNGLQFIPATGYVGAAQLSLSYLDLANNQTATANVAISITSNGRGGGGGGGGAGGGGGPTPIKFPGP